MVTRKSETSIDFATPGNAGLYFLFLEPPEYLWRIRFTWLAKNIPRADAKWMGQWLAQLSPQQIRDAFRAANYSPQEVEEFSAVVEQRIDELNRL